MEKCLLEFCDHKGDGARGLCKTHYNLVRVRVAKGEHSWDDLEKLGIVQPSRKNVQSKFRKQLDALVKRKLDEQK